MKNKILSLSLFLSLAFGTLISCNKEKGTDQLRDSETEIQQKTNRDLQAIKHFLKDEKALKESKKGHFKTGYEFSLCSDCVLTYDSVDYYISNGLNYLHGDVKDEYSDFRVDLSSPVYIGVGLVESYEYEEVLGLFSTLSAMVCNKREELEAEEGWNIASIELINEIASDNQSMNLTLKFNVGFKGLGVAPPQFVSSDCYNWKQGSCSDATLQSTYLPVILSNKIMSYNSWGLASVASPGRKVFLTDLSNKTVGLAIYPHEYDTYSNPFGVPSTSTPTFSPTDIFSYDFGYPNLGSNPLIPLNDTKLNYYLGKTPEVLTDFKEDYKPSRHLNEWFKLKEQNQLVSFSISPDSDPSCPDARRFGLYTCFTHRHIYNPVFCNYIILQEPVSTCE